MIVSTESTYRFIWSQRNGYDSLNGGKMKSFVCSQKRWVIIFCKSGYILSSQPSAIWRYYIPVVSRDNGKRVIKPTNYKINDLFSLNTFVHLGACEYAYLASVECEGDGRVGDRRSHPAGNLDHCIKRVQGGGAKDGGRRGRRHCGIVHERNKILIQSNIRYVSSVHCKM